jgi:hypothetical protein
VLGQAGGGPFNIASGTIGKNDLSSGIITSGNLIGSGAILGSLGGGTFHIASGTVGPNDLGSGIFQFFLAQAGELISGFQAVCVTSGNNSSGLCIVNANAGSGLRLPAVGVVTGNFASGAANIQVIYGGVVTPSSGMLAANASGFAGRNLYAGSGGQIVTQSGLTSGMGWQRMGVVIGYGFSGLAMEVRPEWQVTSGPLGNGILGAGLF